MGQYTLTLQEEPLLTLTFGSNGVPFVDNVGIPASTYFLNVYDANGCMDSSAILVTEPALISST